MDLIIILQHAQTALTSSDDLALNSFKSILLLKNLCKFNFIMMNKHKT